MNPVDLFLLAILSICAVRGYVRGLFREIMGMAGFLLGGVAALMFCHPAAAFMRGFVNFGLGGEEVLAAVLIFIGVNLGVHLLAIALGRMAKLAALGALNRAIGAFVGMVKAAVVFGFVLLFFRTYLPLPRATELIDRSTLSAPLAEAARVVFRAGADLIRSPRPGEA